jgi:hypothetical protein
MRTTGKKNVYTFLTVLILFCVFASVFLLLVSAGGGVYKKTVDRMDESYEIRTSLSYVANKVRSAPPGDVHVTEMEDRNVLAIEDTVGDQAYVTYIYFYDGALKELYQKKGKELQMDFGEEILRTGRVDIGWENDLLTVGILTGRGTNESISIYLPGGGEDD